MNQEIARLDAQTSGPENWLKWGPYLSERQWGTVREDYSADGDAWNYLSHDMARSRAYRWGEDGIAGISDDRQLLCFAVSYWNGRDPILKERLFGLTNTEGNHGEDVKEVYFYLDNTPTHAWMEHLYLYPCQEYPYDELVRVNATRNRYQSEYELTDTDTWLKGGWFACRTRYAKASPEDILIEIQISNHSQEAQSITVLPTIWFRNTWLLDSNRPVMEPFGQGVKANHPELGEMYFWYEPAQDVLFTENETNVERCFGLTNSTPYVKDYFHRVICNGEQVAIGNKNSGTKAAPVYVLNLVPGKNSTIRLRITNYVLDNALKEESFSKIFSKRKKEATNFYKQVFKRFNKENISDAERLIRRQALSGLLWNKQFYRYQVAAWLDGDPGLPPPPSGHDHIRNTDWRNVNASDVISMPDTWEYPWFAAWDLAFQCVALAAIDPQLAKQQLLLLLHEWYQHPNGKIPGYEWSFDSINPPIHPWAALEVVRMESHMTGKPVDCDFLKRLFQKLSLNFTWWVAREDSNGNNVFEGGFLGLDNIALFDRENNVPPGCTLEQVDGTAWMAFYSLHMLEIALTLAADDPAYEDMAIKYFEHFVSIASALNGMASELWDDATGFFYDHLKHGSEILPLRVRSLVGLSTLFGVTILKQQYLEKVPGFSRRLDHFARERHVRHQYIVFEASDQTGDVLLSLVPLDRLRRILHALFDEQEFLSPFGIRSVSKYHQDHPVEMNITGHQFGLKYEPGASESGLFGGNSNWRGPIWIPTNYLLIHGLRTYHQFYGKSLSVEIPSNSGRLLDLEEASRDIANRLLSLFSLNQQGSRPAHQDLTFLQQPEYRDLVLFYEYFHAETGKGLGASHQTGWTALAGIL